MKQTPKRTPEQPRAEARSHRPVWWLEDPFGSIVTGMIAPAVAVAVLAATIAALSSGH